MPGELPVGPQGFADAREGRMRSRNQPATVVPRSMGIQSAKTRSVVRSRTVLSLLLVCLFPCTALAQAPARQTSTLPSVPNWPATPPPRFAVRAPKPRVVITTDGEVDDRESMIRFLLYSNEFDVEALIYNSSIFHWLGHNWSGVEWIHGQLEMYSRIYPNLRANADGYPTPDQLKSRVYVGNITAAGEMEQDSPGADKIVQLLLDDKPGPVYLDVWGGTNTIARALSKIQRDHPDQMERVSRKAVVFVILDQDSTLRSYIEPNWPKLQIVGSFQQFGVLAYAWADNMPASKRVFFERPWMEGNITVDHGSLAGAYESQNGAFRSEGDSPSFMYEIPTGLRSLESPSYGGWGGRFVAEKPNQTNVWTDASDDGDVYKPIWRWADAFQNDFAARAAWSVKPYRDANHPPIVNIEGPEDRTVAAGSTVTLSVAGSSDPDGDHLSYLWWQYREAGSYGGKVVLQADDTSTVRITVPGDAKLGETIHLIAEVTDSGKPQLTRYARFILTVDEPPRRSK